MKRTTSSLQPSPPDEEATPPERKAESFSAWFRSWRYFFWLLGLCLLVALFYAEENWRGERAWETTRSPTSDR